jgi:hypothetical protein
MTAFLEGNMSASDFVTRYMARWKTIRTEQYQAIARHPTAQADLYSLQARHGSGELSNERYLRGAQEIYQSIEPVSVPVGSAQSAVLDDLFVSADAYRENVDDADSVHVVEDELRDEVAQALATLDGGARTGL